MYACVCKNVKHISIHIHIHICIHIEYALYVRLLTACSAFMVWCSFLAAAIGRSRWLLDPLFVGPGDSYPYRGLLRKELKCNCCNSLFAVCPHHANLNLECPIPFCLDFPPAALEGSASVLGCCIAGAPSTDFFSSFARVAEVPRQQFQEALLLSPWPTAPPLTLYC